MKKLLVEYSRIIGTTFTGLVFGLSCFLLFINLYHYKEVNTMYTRTENDKIIVEDIYTKVEQVRTNIANFKANEYKGNERTAELLTLQAGLKICTSTFDNEELKTLLNKETIGIVDVYQLNQLFTNEILNTCVVKQTYNLTVAGEEAKYHFQSLDTLRPFIKLSADNLLKSTNYVNRIMDNNSSYYMSSDDAKAKLEFTRDNYSEVLRAYNNSADYILYLSEWFVSMSGGVR